MGVWQVDVPAGRATPRRFALVRSELQPDGARVHADAAEFARLEGNAICVATFSPGNDVVVLAVPPRCVPKAPPMFWVERADSDAHPPASYLEAHDATGGQPDVLLSASDSDPIGWVRWFPLTGLIDDIWVEPELRRRGIATALLYAADTLSLAREWRRLWADGQRTDLGDQLREGGDWRSRAADRTHVTPPG
jgi:GNAT superfamily N-acetyltransferase